MRRRMMGYKPFDTHNAIVFDQSISDPANISGDVNKNDIREILSQWRRCLCKKTGNSAVAICYLNDYNSNLYIDGTPSVLTGGEGDVMVYKPEFWYKHKRVSSTKFAYRISESYVNETWIHSPESLIGAYKGRVEGNMLYSRSGVAPTTRISCVDFGIYALSRGVGYQIIDYEQHCMIALMSYAKYGTRDLQSVLGTGNAYTTLVTGSSNATGNTDTQGETSNYVCGLGIEGIFGGINEWVSGVSISNGVWTIINPDGVMRTINSATLGGYIINIAAENGPYFDIIPTNVGGSYSTYYTDYFYNSTLNSSTLARSNYSTGLDGGVAYTNIAYNNSSISINAGSRLAFRGTINVIQSVSEFKSLPLL